MVNLCLLTYINLPSQRTIYSARISSQTNEVYDISISIPKVIWLGQSEKIVLYFSHPDLDEVSETINNSSIKNLEVNIILNGAVFTPPGTSITPIIQNKDITLQWQVDPVTGNDIIGSIWVHINSASDSSASEFDHQLIFTKDYSVELLKFHNLDISIVQIILSGLIIILLIIIFWKNLRQKNTI